MIQLEEKYSYDDVLLQPAYADFLPSETSVKTRLAGNIYLNAPIISAAMDTVTEYQMAIALALEGGAGVIHRNLPPEEQARQVERVKRYLNWIIANPVIVHKGQTVADVEKIMMETGVTGLPVLDGKKLCGIITNRDMRFCANLTQNVEDVMTTNLILERGTPSVETAREKFDKHRIEKLPVVDHNDHLTGLITVSDMEKHKSFPSAALDESGSLVVGAAVSPNDYRTRIPLLQKMGCDFVVLDTAHGNSLSVVRAVEGIKKEFGIKVIGGNVADGDGARRLIEAGSDAIKVGVGPGSICTTRIVAGIGVPQLSAVYESAEEASKHNIPIIADGGIKYSGDITKAIAAGASCIMVGNLFAGLKEAPGKEVIFEGRIFKQYRGMGSVGAIKEGSGDRYQMKKDEEPVPEGIEGRVPFKGELKPYLNQLVTGLKKGMGYCGCRTIEELRSYQKFVKISSAGLRESHAHDVNITQEAPNYSRY
ncbi:MULTISPECIES: IMP dehydrogenase [unclassified Oceanispirochaeta]|uniref:IMP dehydrogenase n=1 Tax=unclassified Oceanispirochaeta TaxID=2635722 RepID=UPI000E092572|nr:MULTISPECIES: IMP dehydrogenase [unclassified Oceanispirochaeta]MBF9015105.1 IMP dehydrogenase [Oceanispirochaeta sp. M2]NPD71563.1 IMP dehydrogenase [Oceanispirochaeta sp. M1]RDG33132.1 IMP dehydrogenase [Oceanispirochaeta sp. M1]